MKWEWAEKITDHLIAGFKRRTDTEVGLQCDCHGTWMKVGFSIQGGLMVAYVDRPDIRQRVEGPPTGDIFTVIEDLKQVSAAMSQHEHGPL